MKKYRVTFEQKETFYTEVEARDKQEADDLASENISNGDYRENGDCAIISIEVKEI